MKIAATRLLLVTTFLVLASDHVWAGASNVYIAQNGAGASNGSNCSNAQPVSFFNTASSWGGGAAQIGPGTVVHLCGTISNELQVQGSGTNGNVITILWEPGARISLPVGSAFGIGGNNYLLFDGGTPCGPSTTCSSTDSGTGIIENTANGSGLANQTADAKAFDAGSGAGNLEMRNLVIRNLYVHSSMGDTSSNIDIGTYGYLCSGCVGTISMHDNTIHDLGIAMRIETPNAATLQFYRNYVYHNNWGLEDSGSGVRRVQIHDNHFGSTSNWDTTADAFHHNGLHLYQLNAADSLETSFYNNLMDGNWGSCCATDIGIYQENTAPANFFVYNNVAIQGAGNTAPVFVLSGVPLLLANNTMLGSPSTGGNIEPMYIGGQGVSIKNNATENFGQYILIYAPGLVVSTIDYNVYGALGQGGNAPFAFGGSTANALQNWQAACGCDSHAKQVTSLGVNALGVPQSGSPLLGAGANLTSLGIAALNMDTSAGGTRTPSARPATGAWDAGAYQSSSSAPVSSQLNPPVPTGITSN